MRKQDITYQDKLNELRLDLSHPKSKGIVYILVEGESDIRLFRKFFDLDKCKVESIPGGKIKLEECVSELIAHHSLVIGIRDADFIHLANVPYAKGNMFLSDYHDIEMNLIAEDAVFSAILFEFTDLPAGEHNSKRASVFKSIEEISFLKWLNENEELRIEFGKTGFQDLLSFVDQNIDFPRYFSRILSKSPNAKITDIDVISAKIDALRSHDPNPYHLSNGHDFIKALSQYIRVKGKVNNVSDDFISSALRMNFNVDHLSKTQLYNNTKHWADLNSCPIYK